MTWPIAILLICLSAFAQSLPPGEDEQKAIAAEAREVALHYTDALPNFTCDQDTDRYVNLHGEKSKVNWKRQDRYTARLSYNGVMEDYKVFSLNGHPVHDLSLESLGGTISKGDFASALRFIFESSSEAKFDWHEWASLRGRICYMFRYSVERAHSRWRITEGSTGKFYQTGYEGIVYIAQDSKQTLKLTLETVGIPDGFPIQFARQELDYDVATIGGKPYLLPFSSETRINIGHELHRNISSYSNYRKFSADANITFH